MADTADGGTGEAKNEGIRRAYYVIFDRDSPGVAIVCEAIATIDCEPARFTKSALRNLLGTKPFKAFKLPWLRTDMFLAGPVITKDR